MAHELTKNRLTGKIEHAFTGEVGWHGLGNYVTPGASLETWLEEAGMTYTIRRVKLQYYADRAQTDLRTDPDMVALIRSDTGDRLGIVSNNYQVVQPYEVIEFFRSLVEDAGFTIETAGTLFDGKRYWCLAKVASRTIAGWDDIGGYLLLSTTADGTRATDAQETSVRVVCNNTLQMAFGEVASSGKKKHVRVSHRQRFDPEAVKQQLGATAEHFHAFADQVEVLAKKKISDDAAEAFVLSLLRPTDAQIEEVLSSKEVNFEELMNRPFKLRGTDEQELIERTLRRPRGADDILALFHGAGAGSAQKGSEGTAWGLVNAVTEYVDHHATAKTDSHRFERATWGAGADMKLEALQAAIAL